MAQPTPKSYNTYTADGILTDFSFTKGYMAKAHVQVYVAGVLQTLTTHYTWPDATTVRFLSAPADTSLVLLKRVTPRTKDTDFEPGAKLSETIMDNQYLQLLYILQELEDVAAHSLQIPFGEDSLLVPFNAVDDVKISAGQDNLQYDLATVEWKLAFDGNAEPVLTIAKNGEATTNVAGIGQCS
jgi:hypothetical protein